MRRLRYAAYKKNMKINQSVHYLFIYLFVFSDLESIYIRSTPRILKIPHLT